MMRLGTSVVVLACAAVAGCGVRTIKAGDIPSSQQGVAFIKVILHDKKTTMIHIFTKGDRVGPHQARIDASPGEHIYAIFLPDGTYDIGQVSNGYMTNIWPPQSRCPAFTVLHGHNNYIGTVELSMGSYGHNGLNLTREYGVKCGIESDVPADVLQMFRESFQALYDEYPIRVAAE